MIYTDQQTYVQALGESQSGYWVGEMFWPDGRNLGSIYFRLGENDTIIMCGKYPPLDQQPVVGYRMFIGHLESAYRERAIIIPLPWTTVKQILNRFELKFRIQWCH